MDDEKRRFAITQARAAIEDADELLFVLTETLKAWRISDASSEPEVELATMVRFLQEVAGFGGQDRPSLIIVARAAQRMVELQQLVGARGQA